MSKRILMVKLGILCKMLNKKVGYTTGDLNLDHNSVYGGYKIVEYMDKGGEHHPLLNKRLPAQQMSDAIDMAIDTLRFVGA